MSDVKLRFAMRVDARRNKTSNMWLGTVNVSEDVDCWGGTVGGSEVSQSKIAARTRWGLRRLCASAASDMALKYWAKEFGVGEIVKQLEVVPWR